MKIKSSTTIADSKSDLSFLAEIPKRRPDIDDRPIIFKAPLCEALTNLGVKQPQCATLLINQLHFWMNTSAGCSTKDGTKWIYNRYQDWLKQIPGLSVWMFGEVTRSLANIGIVIKETFAGLEKSFVKPPRNFHKDNQTSFLTLDIDRLRSLAEAMGYSLSEWLGVLPKANIATATLQDCYSKEASLLQQESTIYTEKTHISISDTQSQKKKTGKFINKTPEASQYKDDPWAESLEQPSQPVAYQEIPQAVEQSPQEDTNALEVREVRNRKLSHKKDDTVREPYVWEVEVGKPLAKFQRWRANRHYKRQGKHWETGAYSNAYSEFYNNPVRTTNSLFPEYMEHCNKETQSVEQNQAHGLDGILSSDFIPLPEPTEENLQQIKENYIEVIKAGARVAIESNGVPGSTQTISFAEAEAHKRLKPLAELLPQLPPSQDSQPKLNEDEKLLEDFRRNKAMWKVSRKHYEKQVREWAENTPGIIFDENSEYGISLEPELERRLPKQSPE